MHDVFDYLYWRGDLSFEVVPFNEIDNLIMARLSYLPLDKIATSKITIKEAYLKSTKLNLNNYLNPQDKNMFKELSMSLRYKDVILDNFVNKMDYIKEQQFGAVTIILPNNTVYISYRGTDNTLIGWKEDLNMTFESILPSQTESVLYLNKLVDTTYNIIVGGHSKGGNLAIYAALNCDKKIQDRIVAIYNNDGPGFLNEITDQDKYIKIEPKIHTYIPGSSVVGRLLNNNNKYTIVNSDNKYILQHDLYSWKIRKDTFVYQKSLNKDSIDTEKVIDEWLNSLTYDDRKKFIDIVYNIVASTKAKTIDDLDQNKINTLKTIILSVKNSNKGDRETISKVFDYLLKSLKNNFIK